MRSLELVVCGSYATVAFSAAKLTLDSAPPLLPGECPLDLSHARGASHPHHRDGDPRQALLLVGRLHAVLLAFALDETAIYYTPLLYM